MARKKKKAAESGGATWLDTYADTVTLLMTFFVLLYSMSTIDENKLKQLSEAFNEVMQGKPADSILQYNLYDGEVPLVGGESKYEDIGDLSDATEQTYEEVSRYVEENQLQQDIEIRKDERGIILQVKDSILFETGSSALKPDSTQILDKISELISTLPNSIKIEGHTDNVPIKTSKYESNWELSSDRAVKVLRYFTEVKKLNGGRFTAEGCGEYSPIVPNTSDENRAMNRRVNILLVANNEE